jgi:nucleoside phosphorylase
LREEVADAACMSVLGWIQILMGSPRSPKERDALVAFALYDLATKARPLPPRIQHQFIGRAIEAVAQANATSILKKALQEVGAQGDELLTSESRETAQRATAHKWRADVFIVTVIGVEKTAALKAFGIDAELADKSQAFVDVHNRRCYRTQIAAWDRRRGKRDLQIYITVVGEPRNVPCANVCRDIMETIDVDLFMLVGIAGGNERVAEGGDVVGALGVYYVEGGKRRLITPEVAVQPERTPTLTERFGRLLGFPKPPVSASPPGAEPQVVVDPEIIPATLRSPAKEYLLDFAPKKSDLVHNFDAVTTRYGGDDWPDGNHSLNRDFSYHQGFVMCGEKVLVDGSVPKVASAINRKVACVDMESYGFASTCEHKAKNWIVFRGISDVANPKKDDAQHVSASVAAAVTARLFLTESYIEFDARDQF